MSASAVQQNTVWITENNSAVTTSNNGGNSGVYETILDLNTPTGVEYQLRPAKEMVDRMALRLRMNLADSGNSDLPDDASVKFVGQTPVEEDTTQIGDSRQLRHFKNANQYNEEEVFRIDINQRYTFSEDSHLKLQLDSTTAVDWSSSGTWIELEIVRIS